MDRKPHFVWINVSKDHQGWRPYFTVIKEQGQMIMFMDQEMTQMSYTFDLTQWNADSTTISSTKSSHRSFRMTFSTKEGAIYFAFEKEVRRREFMAKMTPFLENDLQNELMLKIVHLKLDSKFGVIQEFEDETMRNLLREIHLDDVEDDGVKVVENRIVLNMKGDDSHFDVRVKDEETRNNIVNQIRNQIRFRKEFNSILAMYNPDTKIFENINGIHHCNGKGNGDIGKCAAIKRICAALDFYDFLLLSEFCEMELKRRSKLFREFVDRYYPKRVFFNDYIHWTMCHMDADSLKNIQKNLKFTCDSAKKCGATARHYSERRVGSNGADHHWATEKMDSYHFNIYHLNEMGLRLNTKSLQNAVEANDETESMAISKNKMSEVLKSKRAEFTTERLDGVTNSKFMLNINDQSSGAKGTGNNGLSSISS